VWTPGIGELLIILVIVLVLFGAGKLPQVGRSLGSAISEFKSSLKGENEGEHKPADSDKDKEPK
jgi:sec-independent protein translocase protein TatA